MLGLIGLLDYTISNLLSVSAAIFLETCMYMSSGLYSSKISLHLLTLSVLNVLKVKFLWSEYTLICCVNYIYLSSFSDSTIESNSPSVVV